MVAWRTPAAAAPWLFVTDIHYDPAARGNVPARLGSDSNEALLESALRAMRRADPHPPVVVIGGDEFAHQFDSSRASATMAYLARRFDRAFPAAQFVITLGNEDSPCGDYALPSRSLFLRDTARDWAPLVNRRGAAPAFEATFARDGYYTTRLPLAHTTAVVIDDVFWSPRYRSCAAAGHPAAATIAQLRRALRESSDQHWVLLHIPPGIDAFSTAHVVRGLAVVPFLDPAPRDALLGAVAEPATHVTLVLAAHTHKFAYRIAGTTPRPIPILLMPSISPIFRNAPAFLTAEVDAGGTLRNVNDTALVHGVWRNLGGFPALGVTRFTGAALVDLQRRLARSRALQARFGRLYESGGTPEIDPSNWLTYSCSAIAFTATAFRACVNVGGVSILTTRGVSVAALAALAGLAFLGAAGAAVWMRRKRARTHT